MMIKMNLRITYQQEFSEYINICGMVREDLLRFGAQVEQLHTIVPTLL
jgi:hypothetical protein